MPPYCPGGHFPAMAPPTDNHPVLSSTGVLVFVPRPHQYPVSHLPVHTSVFFSEEASPKYPGLHTLAGLLPMAAPTDSAIPALSPSVMPLTELMSQK